MGSVSGKKLHVFSYNNLKALQFGFVAAKSHGCDAAAL